MRLANSLFMLVVNLEDYLFVADREEKAHSFRMACRRVSSLSALRLKRYSVIQFGRMLIRPCRI